jgi:uncharacterized membrane protein YesL
VQRLPVPIRIIVVALIDWWDAWLNVAIINTICGLCWLTVVLGPPATFGMYYAMNELAHGRGTGVRDMIDSARRYFLKSWLWMALNLIIAALVVISVQFYGSIRADWGPILQGVLVILTALWLVVQFYALPYLMEQEEKRLLVAMRNGLFTAFAGPLYTFVVVGFAALVAVISVPLIALLFLGGPAYIAILGNRAVLERIETFGVRQRDAQRHEDAKPDEG